MPKKWFPLAATAAIAGGFFLWWSMDDYERARYFAILVGVPHSAMVALGLLGHSGELPSGWKMKTGKKA